MPPCTPAPACRALLAEATRRAPNRRTTSDGICASPRHTAASPSSDHEPHVQIGDKHYATAVDLSDDKAGGCDADALAESLRLRRDWRVKYVICNRRMFSSYPTSKCPAWEWRPYTGSNPHETHTHISIVPEAIHDTGPWWVEPAKKEFTLDATDRKYLDTQFAAIHKRVDDVEEILAGRTPGQPKVRSLIGRIGDALRVRP